MVRDGIWDDMVQKSHQPYPLDGKASPFSLEELFGAKMKEELSEFDNATSYEDQIKEVADVLAAWDSYRRKVSDDEIAPEMVKYHDYIITRITALEIDLDVVKGKQAELKEKYGEFDNSRYVHAVSLLPDDEYVAYYEANPSRYPRLSSVL